MDYIYDYVACITSSEREKNSIFLFIYKIYICISFKMITKIYIHLR